MIKRDMQQQIDKVVVLIRATITAIEDNPQPTQRELGKMDQAQHTLSLLALAGLVRRDELGAK